MHEESAEIFSLSAHLCRKGHFAFQMHGDGVHVEEMGAFCEQKLQN